MTIDISHLTKKQKINYLFNDSMIGIFEIQKSDLSKDHKDRLIDSILDLKRPYKI